MPLASDGDEVGAKDARYSLQRRAAGCRKRIDELASAVPVPGSTMVRIIAQAGYTTTYTSVAVVANPDFGGG